MRSGHTTSLGYNDAHGNCTSLTDPLGATVTYNYDDPTNNAVDRLWKTIYPAAKDSAGTHYPIAQTQYAFPDGPA